MLTQLLESGLSVSTAAGVPAGKWMQVLSHLDPKYGGISTVVPSLAQSLLEQEVESSIEAFCAEGEEFLPEYARPDGVRFWPIQRLRWLRDTALRARFAREVSEHDGVHIHGLWDVTSFAASRMARRQRKPYLLSSHGMLEPWALNQGRWKKRLYSLAIEREVVRRATILHALTHAEALQYREYSGRRTPTAVIPNGVALPQHSSPEPFLSRYPELRGRRCVLFLARLHPKKGVDLLVDSWRQVSARFPDAFLVLAGPDSENMAASLRAVAAAHGTQHSILFAGMLDAEAKWSGLAAAEGFVMPSHSEGLSMSVLEAMGAGVPVVLTPQCNMPWVFDIGAGWSTEPNAGAIAESLLGVLSRTKQQNAETGRVGSTYIRQHYSWSSVSERMSEIYRWCLGGNKPVLSEVLQ